MKNRKFLISIIFLLIFSAVNSVSVFAESTSPEPYNEDEFPQTLKDLRRFEIITLGSMPFVTLDVTLGYSGYKSITQGTSFNPFGASSFSQEEQFQIILTSLAISASIGLTDYIVNLIRRSSTNRKQNIQRNSYINVVPISEDPGAIKVIIEDKQIEEEQNTEEENMEIIE